jgi:serine/threonine protein kinase
MGNLVAIKLMHAQFSASAKSVKCFQQKAKVAKLLRHHNIIGVDDFGIAPNGTAFLVMDYAPGESLSSYQITDASIPMIVRQCPNLTVLTLDKAKVTYRGLLAALQLNGLQELNVKGLPITEQQLAELKRLKPVLNVE